jgi:hypothetical protein
MYEVLSPWAEIDPIPQHGILPRPSDITGKRIGLYDNGKRAAATILATIEGELKARFAGLTFSYYRRTNGYMEIAQTDEKGKYESWLKEQDAVVFAVGD